ncbi:MAG: AI-2E family transporter [Agriterribacter sp.]
MEKFHLQLPYYVKLSQIVLGLVAFFFVMYVGQDIIVPLVFAVIIAILLNPAVNFLVTKRWNRVLAISTVLLVAFILLIGLFYFIFSQFAKFSDALPELKRNINLIWQQATSWICEQFNIPHKKFDAWIEQMKGEGMTKTTAVLTGTLGTISGVLITIFLMPVYIFLFLYYKTMLHEFIVRLFTNDRNGLVEEILTETKKLIQSYLVGLMIEAILVATLNSVGLLIIGVKYAVLLGVVGAILNIIPYIGGIIAVALPMLLSIASGKPESAIWVLVVYLIVQFIDNNFFVPKIVASKVRINALVSIVVVLVGGALWGVEGMFLSIPLTAILKVIFDRIKPLQPFGFILGDDQPDTVKAILNKKKK